MLKQDLIKITLCGVCCSFTLENKTPLNLCRNHICNMEKGERNSKINETFAIIALLMFCPGWRPVQKCNVGPSWIPRALLYLGDGNWRPRPLAGHNMYN